jgi:hypothetical protein
MLKRAGTPQQRKRANNVETPRIEWMSTAGPRQHQNANNSMSVKNRRDASHNRDVNNRRETNNGGNAKNRRDVNYSRRQDAP